MGQCASKGGSYEKDGIDASHFDPNKHCQEWVSKLSDKVETNRHAAARQIAKVTADLQNRSCFIHAGAIPKLVELVKETSSAGPRSGMGAVNNLVKDDEGRKQFLESNGLQCLVDILFNPFTMNTKRMATILLQVLANYPDSLQAMAENESLFKAYDTYLLTEDEGQRVCNGTATLQKVSEQSQLAQHLEKNQAFKLSVKWFDVAQNQKENDEGRTTIRNVLWCITMMSNYASPQITKKAVERDSVLRVANIALEFQSGDMQRPGVVLCGIVVQKGLVEQVLETINLKVLLEVLLISSQEDRLNRQKTEPAEGGALAAVLNSTIETINNDCNQENVLHVIDENVVNGSDQIVNVNKQKQVKQNSVKFRVMDSAEHFPHMSLYWTGKPFDPPPTPIIILDICATLIQYNKIQFLLDAGVIYTLTKLLNISDNSISSRAVEILTALMKQNIKYNYFEETIPKILKHMDFHSMDRHMLEKIAQYLRNTASQNQKRDKLNKDSESLQMLVFLLNQHVSQQAKRDALAAVANMSQDFVLNQRLLENETIKPLATLVMQSVSDQVPVQFGAWSALCILDLLDNKQISDEVDQQLIDFMNLESNELRAIIEDLAQKCNINFFED